MVINIITRIKQCHALHIMEEHIETLLETSRMIGCEGQRTSYTPRECSRSSHVLARDMH